MNPLQLLRQKRAHAARFSNEGGADGERRAVAEVDYWVERPKGQAMKNLLTVLGELGTPLKPSSFDAIALPPGSVVDFLDLESLRQLVPKMVFIEIKSSNQERVKEDFSGFFFSLTEKEIEAAEMLGERHIVALFNRRTGAVMLTSVGGIFRRTRSTNWQVSVQL